MERSSFELKLMSCNKCRQGLRSPGDTWCLGCRALEVAQLELGRRWPDQGARNLAEEILLSATRHIKRLGELGPGLITKQARYPLPSCCPSCPCRSSGTGWRGGVTGRGGSRPNSWPAVAPVVEAGGGGREAGPGFEEDEYTSSPFRRR